MNLNLFEFTEDDLKSNQRGFITIRQKEWHAGMAQGVRKTSQFNAWIALGFVLFGSGLTFGLYMQNEDSRTAFSSNPISVFVLPVTVLIVIGILALSIYFAQRLANKLTTPQIQLAEGKARLEEENGQKHGRHLLFSLHR